MTTPSLTNPNPKREGIDHEFKSHPDVFWPAARGEKTFEFRKDDRGGYHVGQTVRIRCYLPLTNAYVDTPPLDRVITNILRPGEFGLQDGYCILSLASARPSPEDPVRAAEGDHDEIRKAFKEAAFARDSAGYLGTPAQCIADLDAENTELRAKLATLSVSTPTGEGETRPGCSKWGPSFPPSSCNAFEDCAHDGVCHDFDQCQIKGPAEPDEEDDANDAAALAHPQQGGERDGWTGITADEARIAAWVTDRFGAESLNNPMERADRLLEEAIEMQQAVYAEVGQGIGGQTRAAGLVAHVYSKTAGDPRQEMGGVMTCALALGRRLGVGLDIAARAELDRIEGLSKAHFDMRHQAKVDAGIAAQHDRPTAPTSPSKSSGEEA